MSKLQNNFTTPEQSKRLLELGLPAWTADCYYYDFFDKHPKVLNIDADRDYKWNLEGEYASKPCWSVGRLIEIMTICNNFGTCTIDWMSFCKEQSPLQTIYDELCAGVTQSLLDFSKLEE